jgi:hypothetical protein
VRLMMSSTYRIRWTNAAAASTAAVVTSVIRTAFSDGPVRTGRSSVGVSKCSTRPQRGIVA